MKSTYLEFSDWGIPIIHVTNCAVFYNTTFVLTVGAANSGTYSVPVVNSTGNCTSEANSTVVILSPCTVNSNSAHFDGVSILFTITCQKDNRLAITTLALSIALPVLSAFVIAFAAYFLYRRIKREPCLSSQTLL